MQKWFITGTDTDVGKTYVGQQIMLGLAEQQFETLGYKPISAGCERINGALCNEDAMQYQKNSTIALPLNQINPIAYEPPIAPHIAAAQQNEQLSIEVIEEGLAKLEATQPDVIVTEGAGGWRLPLGNKRYLSEFPVQQNMKVILVVGLKLGCLNHAILAAEALKKDGAVFAGWIGNHIDNEMLYASENIDALTEHLGAPLGLIPYNKALSSEQRKALVCSIMDSTGR
jgi:dethiobiotin synthetase